MPLLSHRLARRAIRALLCSVLVCGAAGAAAGDGGEAPAGGADAAGEAAGQGRGFEIAARADRSDDGFGSSEVAATMILRNAAGKETSRRMRFLTLERENEAAGDKSLVIFETPRDVEGTALLSHTRILEADRQWLYLPALKRVKRISSANRSGPFVGSEFAFEDFTSTELGKYTYRHLGERASGGRTLDVVECLPRFEDSGYTRLVTWYDQQIHQVRRIDFFDRRDALLKTLTLSDYQDYDGVWRAQRAVMVNHQTGKETEIRYEPFDFSVSFTARDFDRSVLSRIR
jgi:hypothetical protein